MRGAGGDVGERPRGLELQVRVVFLLDELDEARDDVGVYDHLDGGAVLDGEDLAQADDAVVLLHDVVAVDALHQVGEVVHGEGLLETLVDVHFQLGVVHTVDGLCVVIIVIVAGTQLRAQERQVELAVFGLQLVLKLLDWLRHLHLRELVGVRIWRIIIIIFDCFFFYFSEFVEAFLPFLITYFHGVFLSFLL